ncbi:hypothetical protein V8E55_010225 [Tylopilus felleus]
MQAEKELSEALDQLEARGLLHPSNRMTLEEYIDPPEERVYDVYDTDEEIFRAVMGEKAVRESMDADGSSDEEDDEPVKPRPTRKEALRAALLLQSYLAQYLDNPYAYELWSMLGEFEQQTRFIDSDVKRMKDTKLTSYFKPT